MKKFSAMLVVAIGCFFLISAAAKGQTNGDRLIKNLIRTAKTAPTLRAWMKEERQRLGSDNIGYRMEGPKNLCAIMKSAGLDCSYNTRGALLEYLWAHGVVIFPCRDCGDEPEIGFFEYSGRADQNATLARTIKKNRHLFRNGDLMAEAVSKWKK